MSQVPPTCEFHSGSVYGSVYDCDTNARIPLASCNAAVLDDGIRLFCLRGSFQMDNPTGAGGGPEYVLRCRSGTWKFENDVFTCTRSGRWGDDVGLLEIGADGQEQIPQIAEEISLGVL